MQLSCLARDRPIILYVGGQLYVQEGSRFALPSTSGSQSTEGQQ